MVFFFHLGIEYLKFISLLKKKNASMNCFFKNSYYISLGTFFTNNEQLIYVYFTLATLLNSVSQNSLLFKSGIF